jgi:hypothetical protein
MSPIGAEGSVVSDGMIGGSKKRKERECKTSKKRKERKFKTPLCAFSSGVSFFCGAGKKEDR